MTALLQRAIVGNRAGVKAAGGYAALNVNRYALVNETLRHPVYRVEPYAVQ